MKPTNLPLRIFNHLGRRPAWQVCAGCILSIIGAGMLDHHTGPELKLSLFYFAPLFLAIWLINGKAGYVLSFVSGLSWFAADVLFRPSPLRPFHDTWNLFAITGTFLVFSYLAVALKNEFAETLALARVDPLTGLLNRRAFMDMAAAELLRSRRFGKPLTVAYLDIDNFKAMNDKMGHSAGDQVLVGMARTIRVNLRVTDGMARLGGDEFAIILPELDGRRAKLVLRKLELSLHGLARTSGWPVSFSMGAITFLEPPSVESMIHRADEMMYDVKRNGKAAFQHVIAA